MAQWVIRRADGLYMDVRSRMHEGEQRWTRSLSTALHVAQAAKDEVGLLDNGVEWVELDDAGQPVEAKPVAFVNDRAWVIMRSHDRFFWRRASNGCGGMWTMRLRDATPWTLTEPEAKDRCGDHSGERWASAVYHANGTVTLDEPAPAIAQPSPYSADEPIPYKITDPDDAQILCSTSERLGVLYSEMISMTDEVSRLERQRDEATKRLRGTP